MVFMVHLQTNQKKRNLTWEIIVRSLSCFIYYTEPNSPGREHVNPTQQFHQPLVAQPKWQEDGQSRPFWCSLFSSKYSKHTLKVNTLLAPKEHLSILACDLWSLDRKARSFPMKIKSFFSLWPICQWETEPVCSRWTGGWEYSEARTQAGWLVGVCILGLGKYTL